MVNALSIDVEDYFQVSAAEGIVNYKDWDKYESRVVRNTQKVLTILKESNTKATFFVLGWIAERFPELIKEIYSQGHEIGSHGYSHRLIYKQGAKKFREDIRKSKKIVEKIVGDKVIGYRAPSFSITKNSLWAFEILKEEGFLYDSSTFPILHNRYGIPRAKRSIHKIDLEEREEIIEFPLSTIKLLNVNFPVAGGGYFRFFPLFLTRFAIKHINQEGFPAIVYLHPWEFDPGQPKIGLFGLNRFRHYINLNKNENKLKSLLSASQFLPLREILNLR